jgi:hypothetical protein
LLSQPANTSATEHRDQLVNQLMITTGLTAAMPIAAFLRRDLPLFFETFESYKGGGASASGGAALPGFVSDSIAATAIAQPTPASAPMADLAPAGTVEQLTTPTMDVIKVSPPRITR